MEPSILETQIMTESVLTKRTILILNPESSPRVFAFGAKTNTNTWFKEANLTSIKILLFR
jgi:hypothetical protein